MSTVQKPMLALVLRIGSAFALATLAMLVKVAGESGIELPEIMFWRQAISLPAIFGFLYFTRQLEQLRTERLSIHARRAAMGMFTMVFNFGAVMLLPLAEATTLSFTSPLFAVVVAALVLREKVGPWRWGAVALGFTGILIVAQPGGHPISPLGATFGLISAFMVVVINFQIRDLSRTEAPIASAFYFAAFGTPMAAMALPFVYQPHTGQQWLYLLAIGLCGAIAQSLLAASLKHGKVATIMVMDYTALVWATLYGWLVWDRLPPTVTWLGAPLIVAAGVIIALREARLAKRPSPTSPAEMD